MKKFILEDFIARARKVHGEKYIYVDEFIDGNKIKIICPEHGPFYLTRSNHVNNKQGCPVCTKVYNMEKHREYIKSLIEKAIESHAVKYEYTKIDLDKSVKDYQIIICPEHGEFVTTLDCHINSNTNCPKCSDVYRRTTEDFIESSKNKFGHKFKYDKTAFLNNNTNVEIECEKHGLFSISPVVHLRSKYGCQRCAFENLGETSRLNTDTFINRANKVHSYKYDYSKTNYIKSNEYVTITCHKTNILGVEHGDFQQLPHNHLKGDECPKCFGKYKNTEEVVAEMKAKFGDLFDFSKYEYLGPKIASTIICKKHGEFEKSFRYMMNSIYGCNKCEQENYYYETKLYEFISNSFKGMKIQRNIRPDWLKNSKSRKNQELDIYIPSLKIAIEYQGRHHFVNIYGEDRFSHLKELDLEKYNKCITLGIKLYYFTEDKRNIPETYIDKIYTDKEELLNNILKTTVH